MAQQYQWLSAREHVLKRTSMYAGSTIPGPHATHVIDMVEGRAVRRDVEVHLSAALLKVADEVIVNACDNKVRCPEQKYIKTLFGKDGVFEVSNDGKTIPITLWPGTSRYTVEILFGEMMSGENFNDEAGRTGGGLHGVGVKIAAILAEWFEVSCVNLEENQLFHSCSDNRKGLLSQKADESTLAAGEEPVLKKDGLSFYRVDASTGRCTEATLIRKGGVLYRNSGPIVYHQRFENNLATTHPPELAKPTAKDTKSSTLVRWKVDLGRLGMSAPIDDDVLAVLRTRVYDVAACIGDKLVVSVDGTRLPIKGLKDFSNVMGDALIGRELLDEGRKMEVCFVRADTTEACVVGFVNGVRCSTGTHIELVWRKVCESLSDVLAKKMKRTVVVKKEQLKEHISIVLNLTIVNPTFGSQTKEKLITPANSMGLQDFCLSGATMRALEKYGVVDILKTAQDALDAKSVQKSIKSDKGRMHSIPKYEKALKLSSKEACSLYLTEGDSAKALAVAGFSIVGRDHNGVFPLRGKLVNVQGMSAKKALEHKEIKHMTQILGLDPHTNYTRELALQLPYRHLVIFTDQDTDGAHIMGLVLNWIRTFYPSLLQALPDFVHRFATPIIRARVGGETRAFFSQPEYEEWLGDRKPTAVKYYKGLGTSTGDDAKKYFSNIDDHRFPVRYSGEPCNVAVDTMFASGMTDERKRILKLADPNAYIQYGTDDITFNAVCMKELVQHGLADNRRSIASSIDGLKPSQRKILHVILSRPSGECKVAQLAAAVAEKTAYHHGEKSLVQTMVAMAQPWMGACNIALLKPNGMFGSRHDVRTEHSAERYIFTERHSIAQALFPYADADVLQYNEDDGHTVEPTFFVPIVPFVLINGTEGIGTGWKSNVPAFAPSDVIANVYKLVADPRAALTDMVPSYTGFKGGVTLDEKGDWVFTGTYTIESPTILRITELPPKTWTSPYIEGIREHLIGDSDKCIVSSIEDHSLDSNVNIVIKMKNGSTALKDRDIVKDFKLSSRLQMSQLNLFDEDEHLNHFVSIEEIIRRHATARRELYASRIRSQIASLTHDEQIAVNKARFVREVSANIVNPSGMTKAALEATLTAANYYKVDGGFKYLRSVDLFSLTTDLSAVLEAEAKKISDALRALKAMTPETVWVSELKLLEKAIAAYNEEQRLKREFKPVVQDKKRKSSASSSSGKKTKA
jgi:DNA topoisomerase-2